MGNSCCTASPSAAQLTFSQCTSALPPVFCLVCKCSTSPGCLATHTRWCVNWYAYASLTFYKCRLSSCFLCIAYSNRESSSETVRFKELLCPSKHLNAFHCSPTRAVRRLSLFERDSEHSVRKCAVGPDRIPRKGSSHSYMLVASEADHSELVSSRHSSKHTLAFVSITEIDAV